MKKNITVPDIGDFENVEIIEILVKNGQKINKNDPIVTLESDKSSVEVPSTEEGVVEKVSVKIGDKVSKGDKLIELNIADISTTNETSLEDTEHPTKKNEKIPKETEKIISEAEKSFEKEKVEKINQYGEAKEDLKKKVEARIIVGKDGDIDPVETKEWLESLSAVLTKRVQI